jgi:hypothetical protein
MTYSKMVNDRQRSARVVIHAAFTQAETLSTQLEAILAPALPADGGSASSFIRRLGRTLQTSIDTLVAADKAHEAEKSDDLAVRVELDEATEQLYREVVEFRAGLEAVGHPDALLHIGVSGATPREPIALVRLGQSVQDQLPLVAAMTPARRGLSFDAMAYLEPLAVGVSRLEAAQEAAQREQRELQITLMNKNRALAEHDACFMAVARTLEALFRLAGLNELADRVRPSARRPGQVEDEIELPEVPGEEAPGVPGGEAPVAPVTTA